MIYSDARDELPALIEERVAVIARRDADALAARHAADVLEFNVLRPLWIVGAEQVAPQTRAWFAGSANGPVYKVRDLRVTPTQTWGTGVLRFPVSRHGHAALR